MNPIELLGVLLFFAGVFGLIIGVICVNTVEYWLDVKKHGKAEADKIRKRWM